MSLPSRFKPGTLIKKNPSRWHSTHGPIHGWGSVIQQLERPHEGDHNGLRGYIGHESADFHGLYLGREAIFEDDDLLLVLGRIVAPETSAEVVIVLFKDQMLMVYADRMEAAFPEE